MRRRSNNSPKTANSVNSTNNNELIELKTNADQPNASDCNATSDDPSDDKTFKSQQKLIIDSIDLLQRQQHEIID